jgi:hypothetical protein
MRRMVELTVLAAGKRSQEGVEGSGTGVGSAHLLGLVHHHLVAFTCV